MFLPYSSTDIGLTDLYILPADVYADVVARNYAGVYAYVVANPQIISQLAFLNRALRSANDALSRAGQPGPYNLPWTNSYYGTVVAPGNSLVSLTPRQCVDLYRYTINRRMTDSNTAYLMSVAFAIDNQLKSAKHTLADAKVAVCVNCNLVPLIQNPTLQSTNDAVRYLKDYIAAKGAEPCSTQGQIVNLFCGTGGSTTSESSSWGI